MAMETTIGMTGVTGATGTAIGTVTRGTDVMTTHIGAVIVTGMEMETMIRTTGAIVGTGTGTMTGGTGATAGHTTVAPVATGGTIRSIRS